MNSRRFATFRLQSTSNPLRITVKTRRKLTVNIHSERNGIRRIQGISALSILARRRSTAMKGIQLLIGLMLVAIGHSTSRQLQASIICAVHFLVPPLRSLYFTVRCLNPTCMESPMKESKVQSVRYVARARIHLFSAFNILF